MLFYLAFYLFSLSDSRYIINHWVTNQASRLKDKPGPANTSKETGAIIPVYKIRVRLKKENMGYNN
jgi:hypothetical protein